MENEQRLREFANGDIKIDRLVNGKWVPWFSVWPDTEGKWYGLPLRECPAPYFEAAMTVHGGQATAEGWLQAVRQWASDHPDSTMTQAEFNDMTEDHFLALMTPFERDLWFAATK